jgi:hypothetical protein
MLITSCPENLEVALAMTSLQHLVLYHVPGRCAPSAYYQDQVGSYRQSESGSACVLTVLAGFEP